MYPTPAEATLVRAAEQLMNETMSRYDVSHDAFHVERVRRTALHIAGAIDSDEACTKKPDLLTVEIAALLHDVLDKKYVSAAAAADPYTFFRPFFDKWAMTSGIDLVKDGRAKQVANIVDNVSWSTEKKLRERGLWGKWHDECIELHCVQDADRLDAIGAFGVMRCSAYSAATNRALHMPEDNPAHENSAIQHFHDKLLHVREHLKTEPGRQLGEKRHQVMLNFLKAIDEEYNLQ